MFRKIRLKWVIYELTEMKVKKLIIFDDYKSFSCETCIPHAETLLYSELKRCGFKVFLTGRRIYVYKIDIKRLIR